MQINIRRDSLANNLALALGYEQGIDIIIIQEL